MTTSGVSFVLQWGSTTAVSKVWGFPEVKPIAKPIVFTFQNTSRSSGGIPNSTARAALFLNEWKRARSTKVFSNKAYKKWITLKCCSVQPRWAEKVYLQGRSLHGSATEVRYLTKRQTSNVFGGSRLTLRGTHTWHNPWWLIVWGEVQLNRRRYV